MKRFEDPKVCSVMNAIVAIAEGQSSLCRVYSQSLFSELAVRLTVPDVGEILFVDIPKGFIAPAAGIYCAIGINHRRQPAIVARDESVEHCGVKFLSENLSEMPYVMADPFGFEVRLDLFQLFFDRSSLLLGRN